MWAAVEVSPAPLGGRACRAYPACRRLLRPSRRAGDAENQVGSTGRPGVLCVVPGPGVTNSLTGLGEALLDSSPVVAIVGDVGNGEVYAIALHYIPDQKNPGKMVEDFMAVRYIDKYRRCADGKWRFSKRLVTYDMHMVRPFDGDGLLGTSEVDPSYLELKQRFFQRGPRA